jgi:hypothetical protein
MDLKARSRVLINKVFDRMPKLLRFKFLMVRKTALNFRFVWLKNKAEINLFKNLHGFKVEEPPDLISWLDSYWTIYFFVLANVCIDNALVSPRVQIMRSI